MTTLIEEATELESIAELLERLGGIPPERIPLPQSLGTCTEDDILRLLSTPRKRICELVDGVLVEKAMGFQESILASMLAHLLNTFVLERKLGVVSGEQGTLRMWPGRVRIPDVAFTSWDRFPGGKIPHDPIPILAPNLVVEILSRTNTRKEMQLKREDYFQVGVRLVWEIDPATRIVDVYTSTETPVITLTATDTLSGGEVLPGFSLFLGEFFAVLDQSAP